MDDRLLVEALRERDPGALAELYDTYAESLYQYCWAMLGSPDGAQVALRDTLIAAEAHVGALAEPRRLRQWLLALARAECARRRIPGFVVTDETDPAGVAVTTGEGDSEQRLAAWNATRALSYEDREVLELSTRHGLSGFDLAAVLGRSPRQAEALREGATQRLRAALSPAGALAGPGEVSAARVFALLPEAPLPDTLRVRVMSCFIDPELVPYRQYVARRVGRLDEAGFPVPPGRPRRWPHAVLGVVAAIAAVAAVVFAFSQLGSDRAGQTAVTASELFPVKTPSAKLPDPPAPRDTPLEPHDLKSTPATTPAVPPVVRHRVRPDSYARPVPTKRQTPTKAPVKTADPTPDAPEPTPTVTITVTTETPPARQRPQRPQRPRPSRTCPPTPAPSPSPAEQPTATPSATPSTPSSSPEPQHTRKRPCPDQ
ncbi:RNA polymerase sigma factor [Acrocarpospora catenulata]|uniref:RNA polymerase sigma factor n=1 Tax=Acrocarpospora catenulata TaxID=2836182 RepID=UPI001BDA6515|nr:sigma-70 family RNA polymerase sigma factor [Acrocarpospora catenulata]